MNHYDFECQCFATQQSQCFFGFRNCDNFGFLLAECTLWRFVIYCHLLESIATSKITSFILQPFIPKNARDARRSSFTFFSQTFLVKFRIVKPPLRTDEYDWKFLVLKINISFTFSSKFYSCSWKFFDDIANIWNNFTFAI